MRSIEIESRLKELASQQSLFVERDLEAELAEAFATGGDVDAIELKHLEHERSVRRIRAERRALDVALPNALDAEARAAIAEAVEICSDVHTEHKRLSAELLEQLGGVQATIAAIRANSEEADKCWLAAGRICSKTKDANSGAPRVPLPAMTWPVDERVVNKRNELALLLAETWDMLAERFTDTLAIKYRQRGW